MKWPQSFSQAIGPFLIIMGGWLFPPPTGANDPALGRLFYTPEQRRDLEQQRRHDPALRSPQITLNGRVLRSGGKASIWINGIVQHQDQASGKDRGLPLRVGESLGATGETEGLLPSGSRLQIHSRHCTEAGTACPGR